MPRRTNRFQKLVRLIQHQLADTGHVVSESKMMKDRIDGEEAEVDVVIEGSINGFATTFGFEVRDSKSRKKTRKLDRNAAIAIVGKYKDLVDRIVVVSRNGFTRTALKYFKMRGVTAIHLTDAVTNEWGPELQSLMSLVFGVFKFEAIGGPSIRYSQHVGQPQRAMTVTPFPRVVGQNLELLDFGSFNQQVLNSSVVNKLIMSDWSSRPPSQREMQYETLITIAPEAETPLIVEQEGCIYRVNELSYRVQVKASPKPFSMQAMQYQDRRVLHGVIPLEDGNEAHVVFTQGPEGTPRGAVMIAAPNEIATDRQIQLMDIKPEA